MAEEYNEKMGTPSLENAIEDPVSEPFVQHALKGSEGVARHPEATAGRSLR